MARTPSTREEERRARLKQEADERIIRDATGEKPLRGLFEEDAPYRERISREAAERIIEQSTGTAPSQGYTESTENYTRRIAMEADERIVRDSGSNPMRGLYEEDNDYAPRVSRLADEAVVRAKTGSTPFHGYSERAYRARLSEEADRLVAHHGLSSKSDEPAHPGQADRSGYEYEPSYPDGTSSAPASEGCAPVVFVVVLLLAVFALLHSAFGPPEKLQQVAAESGAAPAVVAVVPPAEPAAPPAADSSGHFCNDPVFAGACEAPDIVAADRRVQKMHAILELGGGAGYRPQIAAWQAQAFEACSQDGSPADCLRAELDTRINDLNILIPQALAFAFPSPARTQAKQLWNSGDW